MWFWFVNTYEKKNLIFTSKENICNKNFSILYLILIVFKLLFKNKKWISITTLQIFSVPSWIFKKPQIFIHFFDFDRCENFFSNKLKNTFPHSSSRKSFETKYHFWPVDSVWVPCWNMGANLILSNISVTSQWYVLVISKRSVQVQAIYDFFFHFTFFYTVFLEQKSPRTCCLLSWTGLKWFMDC